MSFGYPYKVLFICRENSVRSIMAEALLRHWGRGRFAAHSAGICTDSDVHSLARLTLERNGIGVRGLMCKSWKEYALPARYELDFVFALDEIRDAASIWPGMPVIARWNILDPTTVAGDELTLLTAFRATFRELENRIKIFSALPVHALSRERLQQSVRAIGEDYQFGQPYMAAEMA